MKISQHLTFKEWAKAAGACAAAWGAQCICSVDITEELCVAGTFHCRDISNKALHGIWQGIEVCTRGCNRHHRALPFVPTMNSCALHGNQPWNPEKTKCPCRMAVPVQEMRAEYCSADKTHTGKCRNYTQSPQWQGPPPRPRLCRGHACHHSKYSGRQRECDSACSLQYTGPDLQEHTGVRHADCQSHSSKYYRPAPCQKQDVKEYTSSCVTRFHGKNVMIHMTEMLVLLQIAELTCHETIALPPFAALKHLILSLASLADVPITTLQNAVALETLSLGIYGEYADWSLNVIDMSHLPALKHMRIENFAPQELHVPDGCLLHIVWDEDHTDGSKFVQWVQVQSLWQAQRNRLGSLQVYLKPGGPQTDKMAALKGLLTGDQELAYISLWIPELGYEHKPFQVDSNSCQMLALAERVAFWSEKVCSISIADMQPKWKLLSLRAARVNLEIEDLAALVHSLDNFWIEGITTHGFFLGSVMRELYQSNRRCSMNERTGEGTPGGFSCGTLHDCAAKSRFKEVMCCGCSSCLFCLSEGGKLSRDSEWPEDCWHEPAFDFEYIYDY